MKTAIATLQDLQRLSVLINSAYRATEGIKGWTYEGHLLEGARTNTAHLKELITLKDNFLLKCTDDEGNIVGSVHLEIIGNLLYLGMLAVDPRFQNKGIGKFILNASRNFALEHHCYTLKITVINNRNELIEWYERCGFVRTKEVIDFQPDERFGKIKQPLELMSMEWQLD